MCVCFHCSPVIRSQHLLHQWVFFQDPAVTLLKSSTASASDTNTGGGRGGRGCWSVLCPRRCLCSDFSDTQVQRIVWRPLGNRSVQSRDQDVEQKPWDPLMLPCWLKCLKHICFPLRINYYKFCEPLTSLLFFVLFAILCFVQEPGGWKKRMNILFVLVICAFWIIMGCLDVILFFFHFI